MSRKANATVGAGRLNKANQFFDAAVDVADLAGDEADVRDAVTTLLVHAGIAAADAICIARLGEYALGNESHDQAAGLLERVANPDGKALARSLRRLLGLKTKSGYTHRPVTADERKRAERAARDLVQAARSL